MEPTKEVRKLKKAESSKDYDSEDEVASVDNGMASFFARKDGYGTNSLLEQWKESYENDDYDYDPYDDDMYEGQEIPDKLQSICDNLDIKVRVVKDGVVPSVNVASGNTQVKNMGQVSTGPSLPTVVDLMMEKDKLSFLEDTTVLESFPPLFYRLCTIRLVIGPVDNDVEFGTNEGTTNLVNNGATSSGSFFMNIDNDGEYASNTPIGEKIG
ncbi:hypothetical protein Tco_1004712 [Tanacetum coccineum]|uniref:Uncharacterized protein n=1 Tax=Tanacetum coccineum TaxID=301880 RepID=A0ABQ5FDP5_9ASTR